MPLRVLAGAVVGTGAILGVLLGVAVAQQARQPAVRNPSTGPIPGMSARLVDWDGKVIPPGQQCKRFGGSGSVPRIAVEGYHSGAQVIVLAFNDETYGPMNDGGHGIVGFRINGRIATVGGFPGETLEGFSQGNFLVADNRSGGFGGPGYLPPCSGGQGNLYSVTVMAATWADTSPPSYTVLNQARVELGRY
ncbi:MAG: hypothetical protein EXQ93_07600 [Alphaproteobacteria bacterium]|nr:hypothetical protein [Alphaproteobacteria bacterium]